MPKPQIIILELMLFVTKQDANIFTIIYRPSFDIPIPPAIIDRIQNSLIQLFILGKHHCTSILFLKLAFKHYLMANIAKTGITNQRITRSPITMYPYFGTNMQFGTVMKKQNEFLIINITRQHLFKHCC
eukprot:403339742